MALKDNASLALIPAAYKTSKVYSAIPTNGDGDFTFSRSGTGATRINKAGLVETMGTNVPRLNYDLTNGTPASCPSLLLEPSRTNSVVQSNNLSLNWVASSGVTLTANQSSPDGGTNAYKVQMTASGNRFLYITGGTTGVQYTISGYFRADANTSIGFSDGNLSPNSINLTTEWQRFTLTYTSGSSLLIQIDNYFSVSPAQEAKTFYAFGLQAEAGTYATSLIPTSGSVVTRTVDYASGAGNESLFNDSEGTLFVEAKIFNKNDTSSKNINISSGNNSNYIAIQWTNPSKIVFVLYNGSYQVLADTTAYNTEEYLKIAFRYKENDVAAYVNGNLVLTVPNASMFAEGSLNTLDFRIGNLGSDFYFYGNVKQLMYFDTGLTNTELITLTS